MVDEIPKRKRKPRGSTAQNLRGPDKQIIQAATAEKRVEALQLRKKKMSYRDIAKALGLSTAMMAWRYVQDAIKDIPKEVAEEVRALEIQDCEEDLLRLNEKISAGNLSIGDHCKVLGTKVKIREQLARYRGTYAPVRAEVTGRDGAPIAMTLTQIESMSDAELDRALRTGGANGRSSPHGHGAGTSSSASETDRSPH